jgi:Methyl-CpG binding domain
VRLQLHENRFVPFSPQGQKFRSKSELDAYLKKNNLDLNIGDFNFTVRDQGLLDITSNVTHGGIECLKRKRVSEEISVGDGDPVRSCLTDSVYTKTTKKHLNSQMSGDDSMSSLNFDAKPSGRSRCTSMKKLVVRMKFAARSKTCDKNDSSNGVQHKSDSLVRKSDSKRITEVKTNAKKPSQTTQDDTTALQKKSSAKKSACDKDGKRRVTDTHAKPGVARSLPNGTKAKSAARELMSHVSDVKKVEAGNVSSSNSDFYGSSEEPGTSEQWVPPQSPFNLVEESLYYSSWRLLVASLLLENRQGEFLYSVTLSYFYQHFGSYCIHHSIYAVVAVVIFPYVAIYISAFRSFCLFKIMI